MITFSRLEKYGRLGNQMFQISSVISHSIDSGIPYGFKNWKYNSYLLNPLPVFNGEILYEHREKGPFEFTPLPSRDCMDLNGYFQNEKYFNKNRESILEVFNINNKSKDMVDSFTSRCGVKKITAIHVRRGDYLNLSQHHPIISMDYYMSAIKMLSEETEKYVVFSDDIEWCMDNFRSVDNLEYHYSGDEFIDMVVMSKCDNHIIANSSFSWWGSYLSRKNGKCIAPSNWLGPAYSGTNYEGIYRKNMIKI
jgi:hypothetical protein